MPRAGNLKRLRDLARHQDLTLGRAAPTGMASRLLGVPHLARGADLLRVLTG